MRTTRIIAVTAISSLFCAMLVLLAPQTGEAKDLVRGRITSADILRDRINITRGDKAVIDIGRTEGLIPGDIVKVAVETIPDVPRTVAECAVTEVHQGFSVCEIVSASEEIERGFAVYAERLKYSETAFYGYIHNLLTRIVELYAPHKKVRVYLSALFDSQGNVTKFSERFGKEAAAILSQKKRISLTKDIQATGFPFYPPGTSEDWQDLVRSMKKADIDVYVTGAYKVGKEGLKITYYMYDVHFGNRFIEAEVVLPNTYGAELSQVTVPFRPIERKPLTPCTIVLRTFQYKIARDERPEIISHEAGGNVFREYDLKRLDFNIISPTDVVAKVDDEAIKFDEKGEALLQLSEGTHRVWVSFRRGYFFTTEENRAFASNDLISKEVILTVGNSDNLVSEIDLKPAIGQANIELRVYKTSEKARYILKPITQRVKDKTIEVFKN